jgi:hypothetical protein
VFTAIVLYFIPCFLATDTLCNWEQVFLKEPKERRGNLDDRRKIVAKHTSVTNRSLKILDG